MEGRLLVTKSLEFNEVIYKVQYILPNSNKNYLKYLRFFRYYFNKQEIEFIDELLKSLDYDNILIAEAIINNKNR